MKDIIFEKVIVPMGKDRNYTIRKFSDGNCLLLISSLGVTTVIHITDKDTVKLGADLSAPSDGEYHA